MEEFRDLMVLLHGEAAVDAYFAAEAAAKAAADKAREEADLAQFRAAVAADPDLFWTFGV